ncbi:hypothetical protein H0H92_008651, partial [Tricholoma furcatifolium]
LPQFLTHHQEVNDSITVLQNQFSVTLAEISQTKHQPINVLQWAQDHCDDPATTNFIPKLVDHLVERLLPQSTVNGEITDTDRGRLIIKDSTIYEHKTLCINYTTYDNRRDQDTINPLRQSDVMVLAPEDNHKDHPYWYFRVVKIFHAMVRLRDKGRDFTRVEFLWCRGYGVDQDADVKGGFLSRRLFQVGFLAGESAFEFLDPDLVLRAVHLIPVFDGEQTGDLLGPSMARRVEEDDQDYERYYINIHVDRDMFVQFTSGGIGHRVSHHATRNLKRDIERACSVATDPSSDSENSDFVDNPDSTTNAGSSADGDECFDEEDGGEDGSNDEGTVTTSEDESFDELALGTTL